MISSFRLLILKRVIYRDFNLSPKRGRLPGVVNSDNSKIKKSLRLKPPPDRLDPYTQRNLQLEMLFAKPQSLQVFFNFNGHVFEAYEVLGLPLGASYEEVLRHYRQLPPEAKNELIEQAFLALKQHFTGSRTPNNF